MFSKIFLIIISALVLQSCTNKIGKFTSVSTQNVRGLEYSGEKRSNIISVTGKSCTHRIYLTRAAIGVFTIGIGWFMPSFDITLGNDERDRLTDSIDNAVKAGKDKGVFDGDMLVNATIKEKNIIIPILYGYKCMIAEGEVISSVTRTAGFLEKPKSN